MPEKFPTTGVPQINTRPLARKTTCTKQEVIKLASYATQFGYHDLAEIIYMLYWTSLRPSDVKRITDRNVDLPHLLIQGVQNKAITSKNPSGVPYLVVMTEEISAVVQRRMEAVKPGTPLFRFVGVQKRFNRIRQAAGLLGVQLGRDLRRSGATHLLDNSVDAETVRERLGNTTMRMLPVYAPRSLQHHRAAAQQLMSPKLEVSVGGKKC